MNTKRIAQILSAGALSTGLGFASAAGAGASTSGCAAARFTCGDIVQAIPGASQGIALPGLAFGTLKAGAPVTGGRDLAANPGTDWKIIQDGTTTAFEAAPGGKPSGLYLGTGSGGRAVLKPFSAGWDIHWNREARRGGFAEVNDMTGFALGQVRLGQQVTTGHAGVYVLRVN